MSLSEFNVYEIAIKDLKASDIRWEAIEIAFLASCTEPETFQLPDYNHDHYTLAKEGKPRPIRDTINEMISK